MILADSSVWIDPIRSNDAGLMSLLNAKQVLVHPYVIGELATGNLQQRDSTLGDLVALPVAQLATDEEVQTFIGRHHLFGLGIGYIDAHLLAAVQLTPDALLWTRDKRLHAAAERLSLAIRPTPGSNITH